MKKSILFSLLLLVSFCITPHSETLFSPNKNFYLEFQLTQAGEPEYSLFYKEKSVILPSKMGFELKNIPSFLNGFQIQKVETNNFDETWEPVWGEVRKIRNHYNEMLITLEQPAQQRTMKIRFRLFDDGLGFRYEFDKQQNLSYFQIIEEFTQFALPGDHKTFWISDDFDTNEYFYTTTKISEVDASKVDGSGIGTHGYFAKNAVQTPLMMKSDNGLYINIFEAALVDYPAMHLLIDQKNLILVSALAPSAVGIKAFMQTPQNTPWRTIIVSDKATDILASKMILNLNEPCKIEDTSFIKPQKFIGIWWAMHIPNMWTWNYADAPNIKLKDTDWKSLTPLPQHGAKTENVKRYIDFAAANGIPSVLVEGWNVGWEDWNGNWKEEVFDFVTPYPDFDVKEIQQYAASKGVKIIMHHETSASVTNYERRLYTWNF